MGHLWCRIWWWHSILNLTWEKVNFRSNYVKLGQISKFKIFLQKYAYLVQICLRIPKMSFILCTAIRNTQKIISKMWHHHLCLFFFGHCTAKNKDIALKFCMSVVCMYLNHIYSSFLDNLKISDFIGNCFWKIKILNFGGHNGKISQIRDSHFVERSILHRVAFFNCILLQNWPYLLFF